MGAGLDIRKVSYRRGTEIILDGVDLSVPAGTLLGLKGPTGCGKTTLLRVIAGLADPEQGAVAMGATTWNSPESLVPPHKRRVGLAFQHLGLWSHMNAAEHIQYVLEGRGEDASREAIAGWLDRFGLKDLADRRPGELSGGQRHLLSIARTLAGRPDIVLLDEAFAGLDDRLKESTCATVREIHAELRFLGLVVSHDREEVEALCERSVTMGEGRIETSD